MSVIAFYEKVIKVKADVAAHLIEGVKGTV
jgi:hypothetical protein